MTEVKVSYTAIGVLGLVVGIFALVGSFIPLIGSWVLYIALPTLIVASILVAIGIKTKVNVNLLIATIVVSLIASIVSYGQCRAVSWIQHKAISTFESTTPDRVSPQAKIELNPPQAQPQYPRSIYTHDIHAGAILSFTMTGKAIYTIQKRRGLFRSTDRGTTWGNAISDSAYCLALDPQNPETFYVGTQNQGVFKSMDGGSKWTTVNEGITNLTVYCLAVHPSNSQVIYAGTRDGTFMTDNEGWTWKHCGLSGRQVYRIVCDSKSPSTAYATTNVGVWKTTGTTWVSSSQGLPADVYRGNQESVPVLTLALHPRLPGILYAGTERDGVYRSTDGATTWQPYTSGIELEGPPVYPPINSIAIDPKTETVWVGVGRSGVFTRSEADTAFVQVAPQVPIDEVTAIGFAKTGSPHVYIGGNNAMIFVTNDPTKQWRALNYGLLKDSEVWAVKVNPTDSDIVHIYTGVDSRNHLRKSSRGWYKSIDHGETFKPISELKFFVFCAKNPYVGYFVKESGLFKTTDGGQTFKFINSESFSSLSVSYFDENVLYSGNRRSSDGGITWRALECPGSGVIPDPYDPKRLYSVGKADLYRSLDGGWRWEKITPNYRGWSYGMGPIFTNRPSSILFLIYYYGFDKTTVTRSRNAGRSWSSPSYWKGKCPKCFATSPDRSVIYIGTGVPGDTSYQGRQGILKSSDGGRSWRKISSGLPTVIHDTRYFGVGGIFHKHILIYDIDVDFNHPNVVYAATEKGLYRTRNAGKTWKNVWSLE